MKSPLHILHLEDDPNDAALIQSTLEAGGITCAITRVERRDDFVAALERGGIDMILSDCTLPTFDGMSALEIAHTRWPAMTLIFVSGTLGEQQAIDSLKNGATDYVLKNHLARLVPAVRRAMQEAEERDERKRAEEALRASQHLIEGIINAIPVSVFWKDKDLAFLGCNTAFARDAGFAGPKDIIGKDDFQMGWRNQAEKYRGDDRKIMASGCAKLLYEDPQTTPEGKLATVLASKIPLRNSKGEIIGVLGTYMDITERKRVQESHDRLAMAVEQATETVVITDTNGTILYANPAFEKTSGYTRAEALGQNPRVLKSGKQDAAFYSQMWDGLGRGETWNGHFINKHKDGTLYEEEATISPVRDAAGTTVNYVAVKRDVTHEMQVESQFRQSQKMDAIGKLAGGVAHDFNNILAVIQMHADLLKTEAGITPAQSETAVEIGKAVQRASALTRQLLLFSRKQMLQLRDLDLNESINEMTKMLRRTLGEDIKLQFKFAMQDIFVHADAGMMDQVLMNLAVNARDAMPKGGQLIIETSAVGLDKAAAARIPHARPGSFVRLSVSDTGCGIPPENFHRIFEPFFTTKDADKGTGLGLATVFGIVQLHQGWIDFQSQVGRGTTFRICLPQLAGMPKQKPEPPALAAVRGGDETILLVEDDAALCASVRKILSQLGYCVLEAVNGIEALKIWAQYGKGIHLLLTDLVMPGGMTGMDLGERLLKENPKLKVIYNSGYSAEVAGKDFALEEGVNFLTKPFEAQKLAQTVRQSLDTKI